MFFFCLSFQRHRKTTIKKHICLGSDLQNILQRSYDNDIATIDLRRTTNLQNILQK